MASAPVLEEQRLSQKWNRIRTSPVKLLFLSTFPDETKLNLYQVSISAPSCSLFLLVERIKYNLSVCIINFPSWGGELKKRLEWRVSTHFDLRSFLFFSFCRFVFCENQTRIKKHLHLAVFAWSSWESRHYPGEHSRLLLSCSTFAFPSPNVTTRSKNKKPKTFGGVETCVCVCGVCGVFSNFFKVSSQTNFVHHHVRKLYHEIKVNKKKLKKIQKTCGINRLQVVINRTGLIRNW